jgi:hypothetical protein
MVLFRHLALVLNESGLEPFIVGFAVRLVKIMEDNGIDVNQVEPIISDFATYCFKHQISFDTLIQSGYEALSLEKELGVPVKMLTERITRAKKILDNLLRESHSQFALLRDAKTEYERVITETEEYKKDYPLVGRTIEFKTGLNEEEKCEQYEHIIKGLKKDLSEAKRLSTENGNASIVGVPRGTR